MVVLPGAPFLSAPRYGRYVRLQIYKKSQSRRNSIFALGNRSHLGNVLNNGMDYYIYYHITIQRADTSWCSHPAADMFCRAPCPSDHTGLTARAPTNTTPPTVSSQLSQIQPLGDRPLKHALQHDDSSLSRSRSLATCHLYSMVQYRRPSPHGT